ncbi:MAG: hypothetical protein EBU46_17805 [Nitrosomonadaceae bacterium]|nr:hypothetical protein [Nitrosomonadaceae bacterium]
MTTAKNHSYRGELQLLNRLSICFCRAAGRKSAARRDGELHFFSLKIEFRARRGEDKFATVNNSKSLNYPDKMRIQV